MRALEHPHQSLASHHDQAGWQGSWRLDELPSRVQGLAALMGTCSHTLALYASAATFSQRRTDTRSGSDGRLRSKF